MPNSPLTGTVVRKVLMAISGLGLSLFVFLHLLGNSAVFWGRQAFEDHSRRILGLGPLLQIMEACLFFLFAAHILLGLGLAVRNRISRPSRYALYRPRAATLASRTMPQSGVLVLLFVVLHRLAIHRQAAQPLADQVRLAFASPLLGLVSLICLTALVLHGSHGLWSLCQTLGLASPRHDSTLRRTAVLISLGGGGLFLLIPLLALFWPGFLH